MLAKKYRISQMTSIMLQNSGSLRRGKINTYRWIGPAPTPEFIEHVHSTVLSYHREITRKNRSAQMKDQVKLDLAPETKPHAVVSPTTKSKKKQRTFSFLWGAIKFSY